MAVQYCNYDIKGTLTTSGDATIGGHLNVTEYIFRTGQGSNYHRFLNARQIFVVGNATSIDLNNGVSTFGSTGGATTLQGTSVTLDASADISLDAGGSDINLKVAGTNFGRFSKNGDNFHITATRQDGDIKFFGNDGGTSITALTLDMSDSGSAIFNQSLYIPHYIYHIGDINTYFGFEGNDTFRVVTGGGERLGINNSGVRIGGGARVTTILDEDNMASNSATALATQQSIKTYVDTSVSGAGSGTFLPLVGGTMSGNIVMGDNDITGIDQLIFSGGTYLTDVSSNYLKLRYASTGVGGIIIYDGNDTVQGYLYADGAATSSFGLLDGSGSFAVKCVEAAGVELFYSSDNTKKFETTNTGVTVTGNASATGDLLLTTAGSKVQLTGSGFVGADDNLFIGTASSGTDHTYIGDSSRNVSIYNNAVFTVESGDVRLLGTGRIQGIDTVTDGTDAANKTYVDTTASSAANWANIGAGTRTNYTLGFQPPSSGYAGFFFNNSSGAGTGYLLVRGGADSDVYKQGGITLVGDGGTLTIATRTSASNVIRFMTGASSVERLNITGTGAFSFGNSVTNYGTSGQVMTSNGNATPGWTTINTGVLSVTTGNANTITVGGSTANPIVQASTATVSINSPNLATGAQIQTAINEATTGALKFVSEWSASGTTGGSPDLRATSTHVPGDYYIVSVAGSATPNGAGTTPDDWAVGDWCIRADLATDTWQKIDNTQVGNVTGSGSSGRVAYWNSDSNITSDADLTFDGSNLTVGGAVTWSGGGSAESNSAYDNMITAFSDSGSSTITLTLTQQDGGTLTTSFSNPQGTVTKSGTPVNNQLAVWTSATNIEGESELTYDGNTFSVGGSGNTTTYLDVIGTNTAGAPATAAAIRIYGYEGRGEGIFYYDDAFSTNEWYSGLPYSGGSTYQIGFHVGSQANYVANGVLRITSSGQVQFNKYGTTSPFTGTVTNFPAFTGDGQIIERTPAQVLSDIGAASSGSLGNYLPLAGGTMTGTNGVVFPDDFKLNLGTGSDLEIYHNATNSVISNGTGHLYIKTTVADRDIIFEASNGAGSVESYLTIDSSATNIKADKDIRFNDNVQAQFGTGADLKIYHDGTNNYIETAGLGSGDLIISQSIDDKDIVFKSDSGSGGVTEYFRVDGGSTLTFFSKPLQMADNQKIFVGNAGDLGIYHDGSNSKITEAGVGDLFIGSGLVGIQNSGHSEYMAKFIADAAVELYYDNSKKFETTSGGVTVTGGMSVGAINTTGTLDISSSYPRINLNDTTNEDDWSIINDDGSFSIYNVDDNVHAIKINGSNDITISNDLTVSGGDIILSGTGRIQGIDTVSDGTDAANKDYVDTAVAGTSSGTVTGVSSATTSQLTVSQSSPAPALSIVTAAVANGGTALATGNQIYDATTTRLASYLPLAGGTMTGSVRLNDNVQLQIGSSNDAYITHNATDTFFVNGVGKLEITNDAVDKSIMFKANEGTGAEPYLGLLSSFPGVFVYKNLLMAADNLKLRIGASQDLELYHDGANSYIETSAFGTGDLYIKSNGTNHDLYLQAADDIFIRPQGGEIGIKVTGNGGVELYHNNTKKFETTSTGVAIPSGQSVDFINSNLGYNAIKRNSTLGGLEIRTGNVASINILDNSNATFAGDIVLGASSSIVLDDTPTASTASGSGTIVNWSVSTSVTAGTLYVVKTDGGWTTADADSEAKSTAMAAIALGSNATAGMLLQGFFYKAGHGFALGSPLYISNTAGAFSNSRPTGTGDYVRIIGYATSANYIYFDPDKTWVKID